MIHCIEAEKEGNQKNQRRGGLLLPMSQPRPVKSHRKLPVSTKLEDKSPDNENEGIKRRDYSHDEWHGKWVDCKNCTLMLQRDGQRTEV